VITYHQRARKVQELTSGGTTEGCSFTVKLSQHIFFFPPQSLVNYCPYCHLSTLIGIARPSNHGTDHESSARQSLHDPMWSATVDRMPQPSMHLDQYALSKHDLSRQLYMPRTRSFKLRHSILSGPLLLTVLDFTGCHAHCLSFHFHLSASDEVFFTNFLFLCNVISYRVHYTTCCSLFGCHRTPHIGAPLTVVVVLHIYLTKSTNVWLKR
jgi:hypothetical protein